MIEIERAKKELSAIGVNPYDIWERGSNTFMIFVALKAKTATEADDEAAPLFEAIERAGFATREGLSTHERYAIWYLQGVVSVGYPKAPNVVENLDFSAEYRSRYDVEPPAPRPLNTPRQRIINAAAIRAFDLKTDLADSWELEKVMNAATDELDEAARQYWVTLGNSQIRHILSAVRRAVESESFVRPPAPEPEKPRLVPVGEKPHNLEILQKLRTAGIAAKDLRRRLHNGVIEIRFQAENVTDFYGKGTDPVAIWARRIENAFSGIEIVDTYDTVAEWRQGSPILYATVFLKITD